VVVVGGGGVGLWVGGGGGGGGGGIHSNFDDKIKRVLAAICAHVGVPKPGTYRRYFKVTRRSDDVVACAEGVRIHNHFHTCHVEEKRRQRDVCLGPPLW